MFVTGSFKICYYSLIYKTLICMFMHHLLGVTHLPWLVWNKTVNVCNEMYVYWTDLFFLIRRCVLFDILFYIWLHSRTMLQTSSVQKNHVLSEVSILNVWNILCVKMLLNVIKATCEQSSSILAGKGLHYCLLHFYSFSVSTSQGTSPYSNSARILTILTLIS